MPYSFTAESADARVLSKTAASAVPKDVENHINIEKTRQALPAKFGARAGSLPARGRAR